MSNESQIVKQFTGKYDFLSNFHPSQIHYEGITFPTVEHAFQAAKTDDAETRRKIAEKDTPGKAKRAGGRRGILKDFDQAAWEAKKDSVMLKIVRLKFENPQLAQQLLETGDARLEEGNIWNDTYWGISLKTGKGRNKLGKILEQVRAELRASVGI